MKFTLDTKTGSNNYIEVHIKCASEPSTFSFEHALVKYNKTAIMIPCHDDVNIEAFTRTFEFVKAAKYTDGCGKDINWHYTLALNANPSHNGENSAVTSFAQLRKMMQTGLFDIANHSLDHSGSDRVYELKQNQINIQKELGIYPTITVLPTADEGYVQATIMDGKTMIASEFGLLSADGYGSLIHYSGRIKLSSLDTSLVLSNRYYIPNDNDLPNLLKTITDTEFTDSVGPTKLNIYALNWFTHDNQIAGNIEPFIESMLYIINHPNNNDRLAVLGYQEFLDFYLTQENVDITVDDDEADSTVKILKINYDSLSDLIRWRDLTLNITSDADIESITVIGADSSSYNLETKQINIYKNNKYTRKAIDEVWPPQISSVTKTGDKTLTVVYNRAITQTTDTTPYQVADISDPYAVVDNPIVSLIGVGDTWTILCLNDIATVSGLYYRPQNGGNAADASNSELLVYPYIAKSIII